MTNASDSFLSGGQSLNYGKTHDRTWLNRPRGGMIIDEPKEVQQTDQQTRLPKFWDAAQTQPMMQLVFTVVCDGSGPAQQQGWHTNERRDQADTGHRQVYVKGKDKVDAIKAQLAQHQRPGLRVGDYYYECWTGMRPAKIEGNEARTWAVMLFPGTTPDQQSFYGNQHQPQQAAAPQAPAGFGAPPAAPQPPAPNWNAPVTGQQPWAPGNPVGAAPQPPVAQPQGNAYGYGHQPPASPGGQAYGAAQQAPQGFGQAPPNPGPPPQFGQPAAPAAPQGFGAPAPGPMDNGYAAAMQYANQQAQAQPQFGQQVAPQQTTPAGFGAPAAPPAGPPVPPVDNPWGAAAPAAPNPYA